MSGAYGGWSVVVDGERHIAARSWRRAIGASVHTPGYRPACGDNKCLVSECLSWTSSFDLAGDSKAGLDDRRSRALFGRHDRSTLPLSLRLSRTSASSVAIFRSGR
jgi:hypothetical protein